MMRKEPPKETEGAVLTDAMIERLLRRASELDVAERSSSKLVQLRDAAVEAGISPTAFDKAVAEMREDAAPAVVEAKPPKRTKIVANVSSTLVALGVVFVALMTIAIPARLAARPTVATVEQVFQLNCLTPARAAQLIQSVLVGRAHAISWSDRNNPNSVTVRAPAERMEVVRAIIGRSDQVGSAACPTAPTR